MYSYLIFLIHLNHRYNQQFHIKRIVYINLLLLYLINKVNYMHIYYYHVIFYNLETKKASYNKLDISQMFPIKLQIIHLVLSQYEHHLIILNYHLVNGYENNL